MTLDLIIFFFIATILLVFSLGGLIILRKDLILILISLEVILLSINLNFIIFSLMLNDLIGQLFSIFILTIAAGETAIGLSLLISFYHNKSTINISILNNIKG